MDNKELLLEAFTRVKESLFNAVGGDGYPHYKNYSNSVEPAEQDLSIIEIALNDFEWLKEKIDIDFMNRLNDPEDKIRLLKIMGLQVKWEENENE